MSGKSPQSVYAFKNLLGTPVSTASEVLNQRGEAGKGRLVLAKDAGSTSRAGGKQSTVALVVDRSQLTAQNGSIAALLNAIIETLSQHSVGVELLTDGDLRRLDETGLAGVLVLARSDATIDRLRRLENMPVVSLNRTDISEFSAVVVDHQRLGEMAAEYLSSRGHRRMAMLIDDREAWGVAPRVEGFLTRQRSLGCPAGEHSVACVEHQPMYGVLRRLMLMTDATAIFIASESLALEANYILQGVFGRRVPADISVLGMESAKTSQFLSPPMTTFCQPVDEMAKRAMDLLFQRIDENESPREVTIESRLMERESVAAPPAIQSAHGA